MQNTNKSLHTLVQLAVLLAVVVVMSFTPLGYLHIAGLEPSLLTIPVAVGGVLLGRKAGAILGLAFGITSFIQCFGMSAFGTVLMGINPFYTAIVCIVARVLAGFLCGLIADILKAKYEGKVWVLAVSSLSCALCNTLFFMGLLIALFGQSDFILGLQGDLPLLPFVVAFVGLQGLVEMIACLVCGTAISKALIKKI